MPKKITVVLTDEQHKRFVNAKMDAGLASLQQLLVSSTEAALSVDTPEPERQTAHPPELPGIFAGLDSDSIYQLQQLADLLRARPTSAGFRILMFALDLAIKEFVAAGKAPPATKIATRPRPTGTA